MKNFTITTSKETADKIQKVFTFDILRNGLTIKLGTVSHKNGWTTLQIVADPEDGQIDASDIFWLGYYTGDMHKR